jgi:transposase InsO family protein
MREERAAQEQKTSTVQRATTTDITTDTTRRTESEQQGKGSPGRGKEQGTTAEDQANTNNGANPFFSELVLCTEHERVNAYSEPLADVLLAINEQPKNAKRKRCGRVYRKWVQLQGLRGETIQVQAVIDGGAMMNTMCKSKWDTQANYLSPLMPSKMILSVADNHRIASEGRWTGTVDVAGTRVEQHFEIFDSNGAFEIILGKPWLEDVQAVHRYATDEITITAHGKTTTINNKPTQDRWKERKELQKNIHDEQVRIATLQGKGYEESRFAKYLGIDMDTQDTEEETNTPVVDANTADNRHQAAIDYLFRRPGRYTKKAERRKARNEETRTKEEIKWPDAATHQIHPAPMEPTTKNEPDKDRLKRWREKRKSLTRIHEATRIYQKLEAQATAQAIEHAESIALTHETDAQTTSPPRETANEASPRAKDPANPKRIQEILDKITIGPDLSNEQRDRITKLISEYPDIFALNLSEVFPLDFIQHKLNIDPNITFPKKVYQRPVTEPQREFFQGIIDDMEKAEIIQAVPADFIKCINTTNLAPKDAGKDLGMTRATLLRRCNDHCRKYGLPDYWEQIDDNQDKDEPERTLQAVEEGQNKTPKKWRVCQAFHAVNAATQIPPFPTGDLKAKQQKVAGKRWASVIDLAAGYYAIPMHKDAIPYTAFYVPGRGYYVYLRMPFGLTGAPTTFCEAVAIALDEMIGNELVNWMDDICIADNNFENKMTKMEKFFEKCRTKGLSLAPAKCKLFQSTVTFGGVTISAEGITTNTDKVSAVIDWPEPKTSHELLAFLGLTGFFRRHIKGYAKIAQPLSDLTRNVTAEKPKPGWKARKGAYKKALQTTSLLEKWNDEQRKAFLTLKIAVTSAPVLKTPQYDGRVFKVTTDGSKKGFGGMLCQEFETTGPDDKPRKTWHPIAFCSKRTSPSEERYEPFMLEFAALKFALDDFDSMIYGSPIEIETDCQALRDVLLNKKKNSIHARWEESILCRNITDVRHRPGITNVVADAISRKWTETHGKNSNDDSANWSVLPDWESKQGITNDIMHINHTRHTDEHEPLRKQFADDPWLSEVIDALTNTYHDDIQTRRRARHRALNFMIEGGILWRIKTKAKDRTAKVQCIPKAEGYRLARETHETNGHFGWDHTRLKLHDKWFWPGMDRDTREAITGCSRCKNFGPKVTNALLQPIKRREPFDLVSADYLSLPKGKGGFKTVLLLTDTFSTFTWAYKLKCAGTGTTTVKGLKDLQLHYRTPDTLMTDGGSHFNNNEVKTFCDSHDIQHITTPAYAPWTNGLIENSNKILIRRLKTMTAPVLDELTSNDPDTVITKWPDNLDEAVRHMNDRIIPATGLTPRELLWGRRETATKPTHTVETERTDTDAEQHDALSDSLRCQAYADILTEAAKRKSKFDDKVHPVEFQHGDLVQIYDSKLDMTFETRAKLLPRWSPPRIVTKKILNSYTLSDLEGTELEGTFHARRLRRYIPRSNSPVDRSYPDMHRSTTQEEENEMQRGRTSPREGGHMEQ